MLTDILDRLGIEYDLVGSEAWAQCPMHEKRTGRADSNPSWSMNVESGLHKCFSCGYSGSAASLSFDLTGERIAPTERVVIDTSKLRMPPPAPLPHPTVDPAILLSMDDVADDALASRRITRETADEFGIRAREHLWVLPIRSPDLRSLWGWQVKAPGFVRNYPVGVRKSETLFRSCVEESRVVVVESPLDAARLQQLGIHAAATFGASVSEAQLDLLGRYYTVVLAMDADDAGRASQEKMAKGLLERGVIVRVAEHPAGAKDVGDMEDDAVREMVEAARIPLRMPGR